MNTKTTYILAARVILLAIIILFSKTPTTQTVEAQTVEAQITRQSVFQLEFPGEAIPLIRQSEEKPWLLLLSGDPFLQPVPQELAVRANKLIKKGGAESFAFSSRFLIPDPILLPQKTLRSLLESDLVTGASWLLPLPEGVRLPDIDQIQNNLASEDLASERELASLSIVNNRSQINIANHPLRFSTLRQETPPSGPLWVHIDLSYLTPLYNNEVKTPLFPLLGSIVRQINRLQSRIIGISISASTYEGAVPMQLRFVSSALAVALSDSSVLEEVPVEWAQLSRILYLQEFHQVDDILQTVNRMITSNPDSPLAHYRMYRIQQMKHKSEEAEKALLEAIRLDVGYTPELLLLAMKAFERKDIAEAIRLQQLATQSLPQPAFAELDLAGLYLLDKQPEPARNFLAQLKTLPWSQVYYPGIPERIDAMLQEADSIIPLYLRP